MDQTGNDTRQERHQARAAATYHDFLVLASGELGVAEQPAERAVVTVVRALAALVPFDEMQGLNSQLPSSLRELLVRGDQPTSERPHARTRDELIRVTALDLEQQPVQAEATVRAVFRVLTQTVSPGEIRHLVHLLPSQVRAMWPA